MTIASDGLKARVIKFWNKFYSNEFEYKYEINKYKFKYKLKNNKKNKPTYTLIIKKN